MTMQRPIHSESTAWREVQHRLAALSRLLAFAIHHNDEAEAHIEKLIALADTMRSQLAHGQHTNPPLVMYGLNPPTAAQVVSHRVYAIEYKHDTDGKNYRHEFTPGVTLCTDARFLQLTLNRPDRKPLAKVFR
jgi:hypothetical protein